MNSSRILIRKRKISWILIDLEQQNNVSTTVRERLEFKPWNCRGKLRKLKLSSLKFRKKVLTSCQTLNFALNNFQFAKFIFTWIIRRTTISKKSDYQFKIVLEIFWISSCWVSSSWLCLNSILTAHSLDKGRIKNNWWIMELVKHRNNLQLK